MIGAGVLLHRAATATGNPRFGDPAAYLAHAEDLAERAFEHFGTDPYYGGGRDAYPGRAIFNAIFCRNLLMLYAVNHNPVYLERIQAYADDAWNDLSAHDPETGLFKYDADSPSYWLLDQAGMVQLYACLAWEPSSFGQLT